MTTIVQSKVKGKLSRSESLESRRERIERGAQQGGQSKAEIYDSLEALFAKPVEKKHMQHHN